MKNNVSSTSLKSLLDSYDRDAAANSRKKISTAGGNGTAGMKTSASSLASNIKKDSGIPAITASDAKSMMNAYYKPFLMEAKVAANAEKEQIAAAKKAATTKSSEDAAEITDPYADGNKRNTDFWGNESKEKEKKTETPKKQTKIESEEQKEPGFWKKAIGVVSNGIKNVRGVGEKVNSKIDDIKKEKDDFNKSSDETFTKYNEFIQQGNNRKLIKTLDLLDEINKNQQNEVDGAADNRAELEAELKQFEPEKIQEADNLRDAYRKITGYRIADRLKNTVSGTGKTIGSGALMALDSAKQHISDSSENWGNSQLQDNRAQLENIDAQIQEMQNFGNAYVMDENGSIADENGNLAYTPEFEALLNRKQELETKIQEDAVANPVSKDTSGYKLYQSAQEDLARSDLGLSDTAKTLKGAATSAAENLAIAAVSPAAVLPILSMQGAAGSMGEDIANEVPAGTALVKGAAKFAAGYAINSIGVEQMLNTMGVDGARNTIASQIVKSIKSNSALAQSNPVFYAALAGAGDNGLQSFAEYWADRAIDLATNTAQPKSMEQLLTESLSEMGSGALGGAFTGLAGSAVNAGRQAYANQQNAQQQMIENAQQAAQQEEAPFDLPAANLDQVEDPVELDPLATGDNISPVDPGVTVYENATAQNAAAREVIANLTTGTDGGNGNTNKTAVSKNATVQNPIAQANEDILNDGLLEHSGDGGYGANTVGAAESKYDNSPGRIVQSQSNSIQQSLRDGGATAGEAEMLTDNLTHEQISLKKQTERAKQLIDEVGISGIVEEYSDIVSKGGTLNDEQSATAVTALEELQKSIKGSSTDEAEKMEAMIQRDRLMKAVSANNTTMGRALGYQGNKVKSGIDYATVAHGAVDKIVDKTIESHGGEKAVKETEAKVKQAVENAKIEAADNAIAEIEKQIADAESNLKDAKDRLNKAQKEERQTIRKARRAEKRAERSIKKAQERIRKAGEFEKQKIWREKGSAEEQLARKVVSESKDKTASNGDATSRMVRELFKLSEETAPKGVKTPNKTTIYQLLNEALFNRQAYSDTLNKAKKIVEDSIKTDDERNKFNDWLVTDTDIGETVSKDTLLKAITQTILETDSSVKELTKKLAFAEYDDVVDDVTNYILEKSGVNEERSKYQDLTDYVDNYGQLEPISAEEQNARKNLAEIDKQAKFVRKTVESELSKIVVGNKTMEYEQITDKAARRAIKELIGNNNLREMVKQSNGDVNLLRQYVMRILTEQYGITEKSAIKAADTVYRIYSDLVSEAIDKNMRQLLPELYKIPKTTQPNQHSAVEKFIEIAKMGQYTSEDVKALVASKWGITGLSTEQTNRIIELGDEMAEMPEKNSKAYWDKKAEMEDIIADGMGGGTWTDALASWPYVSMLSGIPKTGSKNVIGNVVLGGMTKVKNATVRPFLEFAANKFSGGKYERTTSNMLLDSKKQQRRSAAYQAYIENAYGLLKSPGKRDTTGALNNATFGNTTQDIVKNAQSNRKVFANKAGIIGKAAQKLADVENAVYSAQDEYGAIGTLKMFSFLPEQSRIRQKVEGFMTSHADKTGKKGKIGLSGVQNQFVDALSREMAAHNIDTYDQLMANRELADQMIQRAAKQANEATLHDVNAFSSHVMDISRAGGIVGKALNPFAKTSANIAVRGAEYSPFGAIEAVAKAKNGDYTTAIDALSKSITGTALMTLGALAFRNGLITIKDDDGDKDRYEKNTSGKQKYSIEIGQFLRDLGVTDAPDTVSVSLESMSVGALPFFMGAGIAEGMTDDDKASIIGNALLSLWDPLADMTLLSGLTDLVQSIQNSTDANAAVGTAIENILMGYVGEYIPTGVKQVGRAASQPTRKSYYSDKDDSLSRSIDFDLTGMRNWIPGLGGEDYVDQLGRTQNSVGGNFFGRLAYNTLSPVTINYSKPSEVDDFLDFVYEQTKKDSVYPDMPTSHAKTEVWNGTEKESYRLSKTEMTTFAKASGKATEEMLKSLEDLGGILDMGGDNIADIQSDLYATARNIGYQEALGDRYAGGESDSMKKNMDVYDQYGTDGLVKYLAGKKAFSSIKNSENVSADANDYAEVLDGLTPAMVSKYMENDKKLYQAYKEHGTKSMAAYERASDRYSEIRDNNGKYTDALLSLDDLSAEEMGYIYSLHSSDTAKVSYLYDYFSDSKASKLSYWFMRYSAAGLEDNKQATRTAWANKYISDAWERQTFLYLYKTAVKDWKIS